MQDHIEPKYGLELFIKFCLNKESNFRKLLNFSINETLIFSLIKFQKILNHKEIKIIFYSKLKAKAHKISEIY